MKEELCLLCRHEICRKCKLGCHNHWCKEFVLQSKVCFDALLPTSSEKLEEESPYVGNLEVDLQTIIKTARNLERKNILADLLEAVEGLKVEIPNFDEEPGEHMTATYQNKVVEEVVELIKERMK